MSPGPSPADDPRRQYPAALWHLVRSGDGASRRKFLRTWARFPLEQRAAARLDALETTTISGLAADLDVDGFDLRIDRVDSYVHGWNLHEIDQQILLAVTRALGATRIFEIGTFDGGTTRRLAEAAGPDAEVFTLDLPEHVFDATQSPDGFTGAMVGSRFRDTPQERQITQIRADAATFDFSPYRHSIDLVFVDAAHDYTNGRIDSRNALDLVRPGGVVIWDDFAPYWWALVAAIVEVAGAHGLKRVQGSNLGYLRRAPM